MPPKFFRTCNSADGPDLTDTPVALLTVVTDDTTDAALFSPESICIVVEDEILVSGPTNLADSFLLLFGLIHLRLSPAEFPRISKAEKESEVPPRPRHAAPCGF
ncbi:hypothetical protein J4Q44_G00331490 [Coregonus suidteri]|uniref:Uncharacterized protein n=1 Tax=Coregonus suidteri TaxID=861788 RepID=A0AAN8QPN0_9TELE